VDRRGRQLLLVSSHGILDHAADWPAIAVDAFCWIAFSRM
jgi:hypothetical protein